MYYIRVNNKAVSVCSDKDLSTPIENLDLSVRFYNTLMRAGYRIIGDFIQGITLELCNEYVMGDDYLVEIESGYANHVPVLDKLPGVSSFSNEIKAKLLFYFASK